MTNRYIIDGLIADMLNGEDIVVVGTPLNLVTHLVDRVEEELRNRRAEDFIERSSRRNGDRHIILADLGSIRALSALSTPSLRGRTADIWAVYRNGLNADQALRLFGELKTAASINNAEILHLD